jgi:hypothetical protein
MNFFGVRGGEEKMKTKDNKMRRSMNILSSIACNAQLDQANKDKRITNWA